MGFSPWGHTESDTTEHGLTKTHVTAYLGLFLTISHSPGLFYGHAAWHVGSYFPDQGLDPGPKRRILTTGPPGKTPQPWFRS